MPKVLVYGKTGELVDEVYLPPQDPALAEQKQASCLQLKWDDLGEQLAILPAASTTVYVWRLAPREVVRLESDPKEGGVALLAWSLCGGTLALAGAGGGLQLYHSRERRKAAPVKKHAKRIVCGAWSKGNRLALAGLDKAVTLTDGASGETIASWRFRGRPLEMHAAPAAATQDRGEPHENTYTLITTKRVLYIKQSGTTRVPLELSFQQQYGAIQRHAFVRGGLVILGFEHGHVVLVSPNSKEAGQELANLKVLDQLADLAYCPTLERVAVGGGGAVRLLDVSHGVTELADEATRLEEGHSVLRLGWSPNGQVLSVATTTGHLHTYLATLPTVWAAHGSRFAQLSSLAEVTVTDAATRRTQCVQIAAEPALLALAPAHLAAAVNHQVWIYSLAEQEGSGGGGQLMLTRQHLASVAGLALGARHAAVLTADGCLTVCPIRPPSGRAHDECDHVLRPDRGAAAPGAHADVQAVACVALSHHFVVAGTAGGLLCYYSLLEGMKQVEQRLHAGGGGIGQVFPQPAGVLTVFSDEQGGCFLTNPVIGQVLPLPSFAGRLAIALWDSAEPDVFVASDGATVAVFLYARNGVGGPAVLRVGSQVLPNGCTPVILHAGVLHCREPSGAALREVGLHTHSALKATKAPKHAGGGAEDEKRLAQAVALHRWRDAWDACQALRSSDAWARLGRAALEHLDVATATAAFRAAGDVGMVLSLEPLGRVEERTLLAGHALMLLGSDYAHAQALFLRSSDPLAALRMRWDLRQWPEALALAARLAPELVPRLCVEHAAALEASGEAQHQEEARAHYRRALDALEAEGAAAPPGDGGAGGGGGGASAGFAAACQAGLARAALRLGDVRGGCEMAARVGGRALFRECAAILEGRQLLQDAARMYELAGMAEAAAALHLRCGDLAAAGALMGSGASAQLRLQYARAQEDAGRWAQAAAAYEDAGDLESVVRMCTERLLDPARAYALVRATRSPAAAACLARHCLAAGADYPAAVEFLLLAGHMDAAFDVAKAHGHMDAFAVLAAGGSAAPADVARVSAYYESRGELGKAADLAARCRQHERAVELYLQVGTPEAVSRALLVVEATRSAALGARVDAFLGGMAGDARARDALRFRLLLALGRREDAAADALRAALCDQEEGNYRAAHGQLLDSIQRLQRQGFAPTSEMMGALCLLHSYVLVKPLIAAGDHVGAARMLVRVARNIGRFPRHVVPILTSTVVECQRAGLKRTALEYATVLMRPEYRSLVSEQYARKIETMVRKPQAAPAGGVEDAGAERELLSDCPRCGLPGPETDLTCIGCHHVVPFDIATGKRMTRADWAECPSCRWPCSAKGFLAILSAEGRCPMCGQAVEAGAVRAVPPPQLPGTAALDDQLSAVAQ